MILGGQPMGGGFVDWQPQPTSPAPPVEVCQSHALAWKENGQVTNHHAVAWLEGDRVACSHAVAWKEQGPVQNLHAIAWRELDQTTHQTFIAPPPPVVATGPTAGNVVGQQAGPASGSGGGGGTPPPTPSVNQQLLAKLYRTLGVQLLFYPGGMPDNALTAPIDMTQYLKSWTITERRGNPTTATFVLADVGLNLRPKGGPHSAELRCDNFDGNNKVRRCWQLIITTQKQTYKSPILVLMDYNWVHDGKTSTTTLELTDLSEMLILSEDQYMNDFVSTSYQLWTAKQVLQTILTTYNVLYQRLQFEDYYVNHFSPKGGQPLDWVKQILSVRQAEWYWDQDVFVATDYRYTTNTRSADWYFYDRWDIKNAAIKRSIRDVKNEFVIRKVEKNGALLADDQPPPAGKLIGLNTVQFSRPAQIVVPHIVSVFHGTLTTFTWYDKNGNPINTPLTGPLDAGVANQVPSASASFIYTPTLPWPPGQLPAFHIQFFGKNNNTNPNWTKFDPSFLVVVDDPTSIALYGLRRERTPIENLLIPDKGTAVQYGQSLILQAALKNLASSWGALLNPFVKPADVVNILCGPAGYFDATMTYGINWYVEAVTKMGTKDSALMTIEASGIDDGSGTGFLLVEVGGTNIQIQDETPAGAINGFNRTFTLSFPPIPGTLQVFVNDQEILNYKGSSVITLPIAPTIGTSVTVSYAYVVP